MFGPLSDLTSRLEWLREVMEPGFLPALNVWEEGEILKVEVEIPGVKLEDVDVAFDKGELTIKGEKKVAIQESATLHRRERPTGSFIRTMTVPWEIKADEVS